MHLHAMSETTKNTQGEEGSDRCDVCLSEAVTVKEGETCTTGNTLSEESMM